MARNGSGTYTLPQPAFVSGTTISSSAMNSDLSDVASALTQSISADGQTPITGAIKFLSGTAAAPGITFASDSTTGDYLAAAGTMGWAAGGTSIGTSTASATTWNLATTWSLGATFNSTLGVSTAGNLTIGSNKVSHVLLNTLTASSSASLIDTTSLATTSFSGLEVVISGITLSASAAALLLVFSNNGGSSYVGTGYANCLLYANGSAIAVNNLTTTSIVLNGLTNGVAAANAINGRIIINSPTSNPGVTGQTFYSNPSPTPEHAMIAGNLGGVTGINAFKFAPTSGNLSSGIIKIYGLL